MTKIHFFGTFQLTEMYILALSDFLSTFLAKVLVVLEFGRSCTGLKGSIVERW